MEFFTYFIYFSLLSDSIESLLFRIRVLIGISALVILVVIIIILLHFNASLVAILVVRVLLRRISIIVLLKIRRLLRLRLRIRRWLLRLRLLFLDNLLLLLSRNLNESHHVSLRLYSCFEVQCPLWAVAYIVVVSEEDGSSRVFFFILVIVYYLVFERLVEHLKLLGFLLLIRLYIADFIFFTVSLDELKLFI